MACFASLWEMVTYFYNKVIRFPKPEASGHIVAMILIDGDGDGGGDDDGGGGGGGEPETFGHIGEALDRIIDRLAQLHAALYACVLQALLQGSFGHGP